MPVLFPAGASPASSKPRRRVADGERHVVVESERATVPETIGSSGRPVVIEGLLSIGVAVLTVGAIWCLRSLRWPSAAVLSGWILIVLLAAGLGATVRGSLYPWSNGLVALLALGLGLLVGRLPALWMAAIFVVIAGADVFSFVSGFQGASHPPILAAPMLIGNLTILLPHGHFRLGVLDIGLLAAAANDWLRRVAGLAALCLAVAALLIPELFAVFDASSGLPITAFIAALWLVSWALPASRHRLSQSAGHPV